MIQSRYRRILWFFGGVLLHLIWWDIFLPRIGFRGHSTRTRPERLRRIAVRFRALAVQMGGVMIKVGQFLSARLDVLPQAITDELSDLQDEVLPETFDDVRAVIEAETLSSLEDKFVEFDPIPLASASIGQVHRARPRMADAPPPPLAVVKVQRPNIQQIVDTDLAALRVVSRWVQQYPPVRKRANVPALMEEFSRSLYEETDYLNEGKNGETFAAHFANRSDVRVPHIYWSHTTRRVLTQEEIRAIKITDYAAIEAAGIDRAEVANRLLDTYLKQIFEDRFFHADPHPGNLFVLPLERNPENQSTPWQLIFVDFGMAGTLPPTILAGLREILIAVGTQDAARLVRAYQQLGVLLPNADLDLLQKASAAAFQRFWGKSTTEIVGLGHEEAVAFAQEFGDLLYEMPFQVPENLILLGRCVGILSGICTGLNPSFNVWERIFPYARQLMEADSSTAGTHRPIWLTEALGVLQSVVTLPRRTEAVLQRIEQGRLEVQMPELRNSMRRLERAARRLPGSVIFAAFLLVATQLFLGQAVGLAWAALAAALLTLLWTLAP